MSEESLDGMMLRALIASGTPVDDWRPIETRPKGDDHLYGTYLIANAKGQVAPCIRGIIHNNVGSAWDWNYGEAATHWMPLPAPPSRVQAVGE